MLGWRDNNLPDWDFWRIEKQRSDPNFFLSEVGSFWRVMATSKYPLWLQDFGIGFWPTEIVRKTPVAAWYLYWLIHKPKKKGLAPFIRKSRNESIGNTGPTVFVVLFWPYYFY